MMGDEVDRQTGGEDVVVTKSAAADEDLNKNSPECPSMSANHSEFQPCLSPGWGSLLPPARHQKYRKKASVQWRPWMEERETEVDKDLNQNSHECPPPSAFDPTSTIPITPKQPCSSRSSINTKSVLPPPPYLIRRAKKRRRSPGDLAKRRKRKFDFLSSQRTPYTPYTEPEKPIGEEGLLALG